MLDSQDSTLLTRSVVLPSVAQKLKQTIDAHNLPFGNTEGGKDWCIKALHPADTLTEVRGLPDKSSVPSVFVNYQTVYKLSAPAGTAGAWGFEATVTPHPVSFMYVAADDNAGHTAQVSVLNTQLGGATHTLKYADFLSQAQRWRMAYMGVTVYQDAPALSDQGTLVASQTAVAPVRCGASLISATPALRALPPVVSFDLAKDAAGFNRSQSMPNAYFSRSKEGLYMPLKLTRTCQNWRSQADAVLLSTVNASTIGVDGGYEIPAAAVSGYFPFYDLVPFSHNTATGAYTGQATSDFLNDVWGHISAANLSANTSYTFFFRVGLEIQVQPGTVLSPHQRLSPPHDSRALKTYFAISRELKDAYPSDYNDAGQIWGTISSVLKSISPALGLIPGVGPIMAPLAQGALYAADKVAEALTGRAVEGAKAGRSQGSLADVELAKTIVRRADTAPAVVAAEWVPRPARIRIPVKPKRKTRMRVVLRRGAPTPRS